MTEIVNYYPKPKYERLEHMCDLKKTSAWTTQGKTITQKNRKKEEEPEDPFNLHNKTTKPWEHQKLAAYNKTQNQKNKKK